MNEDHSTVQAVVRAIDGGDAVVEVAQGGCGRCHEKGGCGGQSLTQMFCSTPKTYHVTNQIGARVGDRVTIAVGAGSIRRVANLAYGLPLISAIGGAMLGSALNGDFGAVLGTLAGLALSFGYICRRSRSALDNAELHPHIVSRS